MLTFYSPIYIGRYFIFITSASVYNPVPLKFRDKTNRLKSKTKNSKIQTQWRNKIYLYPEILQRKWIEYSYKDRFIPTTKYDNVSPLKINFPFYINIGKKFKISFKSTDYSYRKIKFLVKNILNEVVFSHEFKSIIPNLVYAFELSIKKPGIYRLTYIYEDREFFMNSFLIYKNLFKVNTGIELDEFINEIDPDKLRIFCNNCFGKFGFFKPIIIDKYLYKDYIPLNDLLDIENYGSDYINRFIMSLPNPHEYNRGLTHLLNIIRLSASDNEIKIISNLFRDDPAFAYFITNRLFLFDMIPLIKDSELQNILRLIDDFVLAYALFNEKKDVKIKVLKNISSRRSKTIDEITERFNLRKPDLKSLKPVYSGKKVFCKKEKEEKTLEELNRDAKNEINRRIKSYFLEKYGRILKIPISKRIVYENFKTNNREELLSFFEKILYNSSNGNFDVLHSGNPIVFNGIDIALFSHISKSHDCLPYNFEYYGDTIFKILAVDESSLYLESKKKIKLGVIHMYDWKSSLENIERIEMIKVTDVIQLFYLSENTILTIGILDFKDHPFEQVLKLRIGD